MWDPRFRGLVITVFGLQPGFCSWKKAPKTLKLLRTKRMSFVMLMRILRESSGSASHSVLSNPLYTPWDSPGQNTAVGSLSLLQKIFPMQGLNPGLPHCRWILYQLSPLGRPWVS